MIDPILSDNSQIFLTQKMSHLLFTKGKNVNKRINKVEKKDCKSKIHSMFDRFGRVCFVNGSEERGTVYRKVQ